MRVSVNIGMAIERSADFGTMRTFASVMSVMRANDTIRHAVFMRAS